MLKSKTESQQAHDEQRPRQVSNITEATMNSTQHSDMSPLAMGAELNLRRNYSHAVDASESTNSKSFDGRSRGTSGISGELNEKQTGVSPQSHDQQGETRFPFADKVRKVTF